MKYESLYERMLANSEKPDDQNENGCWLWTGKTDGKRGGEYPRMNVRVDGKHRAVAPARVMEETFRDGETLHPDEQTIGHLCRNKLCINVDHWVVVTRAANSTEMQARRQA